MEKGQLGSTNCYGGPAREEEVELHEAAFT
jgi:hypothetical protein